MKKLSRRQKAYQARRKEGLNKRRVKSLQKHRDGRLRQISGEDA